MYIILSSKTKPSHHNFSFQCEKYSIKKINKKLVKINKKLVYILPESFFAGPER